jgi:mannose-6-phosphate isomerase-like protein (cupin superfamily)
MQTSATAAKLKSQDKPKTALFSLKTPYMKQGRVTQLVAETSDMWIHTKINAEGGENEIHSHMDEDHAFIVLEGQMSVFDENGGEIEVKHHQGVMIPKGAYYRYLNTGEGNLVVIRVGAGVNAPGHRRQARGHRNSAEPQSATHRSRHVLRRVRWLISLPSRSAEASSKATHSSGLLLFVHSQKAGCGISLRHSTK